MKYMGQFEIRVKVEGEMMKLILKRNTKSKDEVRVVRIQTHKGEESTGRCLARPRGLTPVRPTR